MAAAWLHVRVMLLGAVLHNIQLFIRAACRCVGNQNGSVLSSPSFDHRDCL